MQGGNNPSNICPIWRGFRYPETASFQVTARTDFEPDSALCPPPRRSPARGASFLNCSNPLEPLTTLTAPKPEPQSSEDEEAKKEAAAE